MSTIRSMFAIMLAAGLLHACARAGRPAVHARRLASACVPDRNALDLAGLHCEEPESYQDLLDESLSLTFPASDPVCAHAATRCGDPLATSSNPTDWHLHPGSLDPRQGEPVST